MALSLSTYLVVLPDEEQEAYLDKIESLYSRICESKDHEIRNKALEFLKDNTEFNDLLARFEDKAVTYD